MEISGATAGKLNGVHFRLWHLSDLPIFATNVGYEG